MSTLVHSMLEGMGRAERLEAAARKAVREMPVTVAYALADDETARHNVVLWVRGWFEDAGENG